VGSVRNCGIPPPDPGFSCADCCTEHLAPIVRFHCLYQKVRKMSEVQISDDLAVNIALALRADQIIVPMFRTNLKISFF
jgi:hypothetical protein